MAVDRAAIRDAIIAIWHMDNNTTEATGHVVVGTPYVDTIVYAPRSEIALVGDYSAKFDGSVRAYAPYCTEYPRHHVNHEGNFTYECLFHPEGALSDYGFGGGVAPPVIIGYPPDVGSVVVGLAVGNNAVCLTDGHWIEISAPISYTLAGDGNVHVGVSVYNGVIKVYIDGVKTGPDVGAGTTRTYAGAIFGRFIPDIPSPYYVGYMDEYVVYDSAFDAEAMAYLYDNRFNAKPLPLAEDKTNDRYGILKGKETVEREGILHGYETLNIDRPAITLTKDQDERDGLITGKAAHEGEGILHGVETLNVDRYGVLATKTYSETEGLTKGKETDEQYAALRAVDALMLERNTILKAKTPVDRGASVHSFEHLLTKRGGIISGFEHIFKDRYALLRAKYWDGQEAILDTKPLEERGAIAWAVDPPESLVRYNFQAVDLRDLEITSGDLCNEITIQFGWDFEAGKAKAAITKHNPLSKLLYGVSAKTLELRMIQQARQAEIIADAVLMTSSIPEIKATFKHSLLSFFVEVGDVVSLTHPAGIGVNGWVVAPAIITKKQRASPAISYEVLLKPSGRLYKSELLTLTQTAGAGKEGLTVTYENGVATITIYADVQGSPPVEGAEVTVSGQRRITDRKGQVRFNLLPGRYTAVIRASGYADAEITFTV